MIRDVIDRKQNELQAVKTFQPGDGLKRPAQCIPPTIL
jgi:hypothetical protein